MREKDLSTGTTVHALFQRAFRIYSDRIAVTSPTGQWTYREIGDRSNSLAAALIDRGIRRGDRVAILAETRPEYVEAYAALASLGVTALALNHRMHSDELEWCVEQGEPKAFLVSGQFSEVTPKLVHASREETFVICMDGVTADAEDYESVLTSTVATVWEEPEPDDIHVVLYTSGTTGRAKGAMVSQQASAVRGQRVAQWFRLTESDGFVAWTPMFHCAGDESLYATFLTGGVYATMPKADAVSLYSAIEKHSLTWCLLLPGVITDFLDHPQRDNFQLGSMRFAIGYANMMPSAVERLGSELDIAFSDAFGQTETSYLTAHNMIHPGSKMDFKKTPTPLMELKIVDPLGEPVPVGTPGECVVRGPSIMSGYLNNFAATEEVFSGGWLHTGDVLVEDHEGRVEFVDRVKFLIKTGGENVYPAEVEAVLTEFPGVVEACVFGVPDPKWGETVKAAIVPRQGHNLSRHDIDSWCRERLAGYKRPRYIEFFESNEIPRSTTGKILRRNLAAAAVTEEQAV